MSKKQTAALVTTVVIVVTLITTTVTMVQPKETPDALTEVEEPEATAIPTNFPEPRTGYITLISDGEIIATREFTGIISTESEGGKNFITFQEPGIDGRTIWTGDIHAGSYKLAVSDKPCSNDAVCLPSADN